MSIYKKARLKSRGYFSFFFRYENAYITDTSIMPIQDVAFGGQFEAGARMVYKITNLECGPKPFGKITLTCFILYFVLFLL